MDEMTLHQESKPYVDSGTAHRCFGCHASIHVGLNHDLQPEYICDRTGKEVHECGIVYP